MYGQMIFNEAVKTYLSVKKEQSFQQMVCINLDINIQKNKIESLPYIVYNN